MVVEEIEYIEAVGLSENGYTDEEFAELEAEWEAIRTELIIRFITEYEVHEDFPF